MQLDLVDGGGDVGLGGEPLEVRDLEVRDADRAGAAVGLELLERPPGRDVVAVVEGRQRPVDQEQVDVVDAELGERLVERAARVVGLVEAVVELARDEDVLAVDAGGGDRPRRRPSRCRTSRRCRCGGSRPRARAATASAVSSGGIWKTPNPSCGIALPSFRVRFGTVVIGLPLPATARGVRAARPTTTVAACGRSPLEPEHAAELAHGDLQGAGLLAGRGGRREPRRLELGAACRRRGERVDEGLRDLARRAR